MKPGGPCRALLGAGLLLAACAACRAADCVMDITQAMFNECMTETAGEQRAGARCDAGT